MPQLARRSLSKKSREVSEGSQAFWLQSYPAALPPGRVFLASGEKVPYKSAVREHSDQADLCRPQTAFFHLKKVAAATFLTRCAVPQLARRFYSSLFDQYLLTSAADALHGFLYAEDLCAIFQQQLSGLHGTPMTAPSSAQGAGETGAADRLAARRRFSLFFTGQAPLVICAARVRSDPPAGARKNTGILPSLTRCVNSSRCLPSDLFYDLLRTDLDILSYLLYNPN